MALSVSDLWKLLVQSRLLTEAQSQHLSVGFSQIPGAATAPGKTLAEWLVKKNVLSKYQAVILLAGRAGPFFYGDYKIYDRLDGGRLSGVFRAVHVRTNHPVLLKFLAAGSPAQNPQAWAEIHGLIPATMHPNLVRCFDAVDLGSYKFLVFEDLRGQSVGDVLERSKRIAPDEASRLCRLAALGLQHLHQNQRVHGDIRPHNFWLEQSGNLKLLVDLEGRTRSFNLLTAATEPDGVARADYAAPEFMQVGRAADPLTDIYALGCSLYCLIAGRPPFADGDANSKLQRHATEAIKPLESAGAPPQLTQVVAYAMAKNPMVRFQQAQILADQLAPFIGTATKNLKEMKPSTTLGAYERWLQQQPAPVPPVQPSAVPVVITPATSRIPVTAPVVEQTAAGPEITPAPIKSSSVAAAIKRRAKARQRNWRSA
jgi:serine/threonine-protein kinase